ncbi:D-glycero-alpha-D-manno-heptose-1,7-bisphosphate 7-phosphatase [Fodinibius sediminis]|uniref:D,D-heptose 1,7-bisphosphate phosphatase n=1 Tax=Fodinibius sediminis TaxID=1214077 RepID=A0A521ABC6_9BACT|nr:HAD family hydrolase [Fodinibius sediminis]SMO32123.1 D-alpha,beta-D-heptose 1,7-bisphosphate phosphatase [Fodinibius sediminis]
MNQAFFLDRDGTINVDYNFVHTPGEWSWCDGAIAALRWMQEQNYKIIVVTNQSGIARGRYSEKQVQDLHCWVDQQLEEHSVTIDDWYYAPHHPDYDPNQLYHPEDRKPGTGMFQKAAEKHDIDFNRSYMAGDKISDLQPAVNLGITPFFIRSRHEPSQDKEWLSQHSIPTFDNINQVVNSFDFNKENR